MNHAIRPDRLPGSSTNGPSETSVAMKRRKESGEAREGPEGGAGFDFYHIYLCHALMHTVHFSVTVRPLLESKRNERFKMGAASERRTAEPGAWVWKFRDPLGDLLPSGQDGSAAASNGFREHLTKQAAWVILARAMWLLLHHTTKQQTAGQLCQICF
ncbi:uncharacterized protein PG986_006135 [Apiospora aurea]|uniref:Uncharacterized protein n=1 Tax=Apiospora aurea TaxID=335848 RepID=A0ABR1QJK1_9PEZI